MPVTLDPAINLVDFDLVKSFIGWKSTTDTNDDLLRQGINAVNGLIHDYTGRQWIKDDAASTRRFVLEYDDVYERSLMIEDLTTLAAPATVAIKLRDGTLLETCDLTMIEGKTHAPRGRAGFPIIELEFIKGFAGSARLATGWAVDVTGIWGWDAVPAEVVNFAMQEIARWSTRDLSKFSATFRLDQQRIEIPRVLSDTTRAGLKLFRHVPV
jgi:hypothetical protein